MYLGSDAIALAPFTDTVSYLEDGDWAVVHPRAAPKFTTRSGKVVQRDVLKSQASVMLIDKGNHRHFMAKEIHEQPEVVGHTLAHYIDMVGRARRAADGAAVRLPRRSSGSRSPPAAPPIMPAWWRNTGSSASRTCRSRSISPPSSATAKCRSTPGDARDLRFAVGRDRRHAGVAALCARARAARSFGRQCADLDASPAKATW